VTQPELLVRLVIVLALCSAIGVEREYRQKSAGLRTHTLVGVGAAVAMMVSKYGFFDVTHMPGVALDPSRVAAQVVSGIGFIGGGLIFVRHDSMVRGLTTASVIWLVAMIGMAGGAGLYLLAVAATAAHFLIVCAYPPLARRLPRSPWAPSSLQVTYDDGQGVLRRILAEMTSKGFNLVEMAMDRDATPTPQVTVRLQVQGKGRVSDLAAGLLQLSGVSHISAGDSNEETS
jgi:putative Mg2+ transporter-C (MgtC) family protein